MDLASAIDEVIQRRRTRKYFAPLDQPVKVPDGFTQRVAEAVDMAGWAPFHYPAPEAQRQGVLNAWVPWRCYLLDQANSLQLARHLISHDEQVDEASGVVRMLAAAGALVLVTWLPEQGDKPVIKQRNEEHLAATAAAIQNLLLAGEARELQTYWSSGGALGGDTCFEYCGIPAEQRLLGAIFMFAPETADDCKVCEGKLAARRGAPETWRRWVDLAAKGS